MLTDVESSVGKASLAAILSLLFVILTASSFLSQNNVKQQGKGRTEEVSGGAELSTPWFQQPDLGICKFASA